jgi:uncharacterized membrane protein
MEQSGLVVAKWLRVNRWPRIQLVLALAKGMWKAVLVMQLATQCGQ